MKSIGSYFSIELSKSNDVIYYRNSILLNSGRNAFEYFIKAKGVKKIFLPFLCCDALLTPIIKNHIDYEYYSVDINQNPIWDFRMLEANEYFLYINYYGLKNRVVSALTHKINNLIIDNTQAFFSKPYKNLPTFYSTRKFFGVADGALLCNVDSVLDLEQDNSADRMRHLLLRVENQSEIGFKAYQENEELLDKVPLRQMSELTKRILLSVDFEKHRAVRNLNFELLDKSLGRYNQFNFDDVEGPLAYPLRVKNGGAHLREILKENRIYTPIYWNSVIKNVPVDSVEYDMVVNTIPIPVDMRYTKDDLQRVVDIVNCFFNGS